MSSNEMTVLELHEDYPDIVVVICMLALFSICGTIGNAFVLFVYSKKKEKTTTTIFILTLAGTDFFTCLVIIPFTIIVEYVAKRIQYDSACKIYQFLITSNVPFSAFIMVVIALDRYLKICRPWNHTLDAKMAKKIIIFLFVFAILLGIITAFLHGIFNDSNIDVNEGIPSSNYTNTTNSSVLMLMYGREHVIYNNFMVTTIAPASVNHTKQDYSWNSTNNLIVDDMSKNSLLHSRYQGLCVPTEKYFSSEVRNVFQKFYASLFLVSFMVVVALYSLVFRALVMRRARKVKKTYVCESNMGQNAVNHLLSTTNCTMVTKSTMTEEVTNFHTQTETKEALRLKRTRSSKVKQRSANIKTAGILFIVTVVFIVAFLPAWLMAMRAIAGNIIIFYLHFCYNVSNPIIYAFFNQNFRKDIRRDCSFFINLDKRTKN